MTLELIEQSTPTIEAPAAPPAAAMLHLLFGKHITYCLSAVARLGVADHMSATPVHVATLAEAVGAQEDALYRVMRLLSAVDVFEQHGRCFSLKPMGDLLRTDIPGTLRYTAMQLGDPWSTRPLEHFTNTVRTGREGVTQAFGKPLFELLAEEPEQGETFNRSMTGISNAVVDAVLRAYNFSEIRQLADVGGGHGKLLAAILNANPGMTGVVYDLPEVIAGAISDSDAVACRDRIQFEAGSFFDHAPSGCDGYVLKFILHDWSDEHCKVILRRIREQLPPNGRVLVLEQIVDESPAMSFAKLLDIEMLALTVGGRERTREEFAKLFEAAGLQLTSITPTESPLCVIEARLA